MQRKKKSETVERLRRSDSDDFATLRRQALRWCEDNRKILTTADPVIPDTLNDRAADNWRLCWPWPIGPAASGRFAHATPHLSCLAIPRREDQSARNYLRTSGPS